MGISWDVLGFNRILMGISWDLLGFIGILVGNVGI